MNPRATKENTPFSPQPLPTPKDQYMSLPPFHVHEHHPQQHLNNHTQQNNMENTQIIFIQLLNNIHTLNECMHPPKEAPRQHNPHMVAPMPLTSHNHTHASLISNLTSLITTTTSPKENHTLCHPKLKPTFH